MTSSKQNKFFCCFPLSIGCILIAFTDLAIQIYSIIVTVYDFNGLPYVIYIMLLIMYSIALLTCLLMIIGSIKKKRFLIVPHMISEIILTIDTGIQGFILVGMSFAVSIWQALIIFTLVTLILAMDIYFSVIMYRRFQEIKNRRKDGLSFIERL